MYSFEQQLARFPAATVLCVGDLMLDDFVYGDVARISPEAPAPVIVVRREEKLIGGAGNVARGIAALGASSIFVGVMGEDEAGRLVARAFLEDCPAVETASDGRSGAANDAQGAIRLRAAFHPSPARRLGTRATGECRDRAFHHQRLHGTHSPRRCGDAFRLRQGSLSPRVIRAVIDTARTNGKPVIVDPKGADFSIYRGATLITPNRKELAEATRRAVASEAEIVAAAQELARIVECDAVLVTRSEAGMTLYDKATGSLHVPAYPVKVRDVSGAGDTVVGGARGDAGDAGGF